MSSGGYEIGARELFTAINEVSAKLDTLGARHQEQISDNKARIETLEKGMRVFWQKIQEQEKGMRDLERDFDRKLDERGQSNWQVNLAIAGSGVSIIIALLPLVTK